MLLLAVLVCSSRNNAIVYQGSRGRDAPVVIPSDLDPIPPRSQSTPIPPQSHPTTIRSHLNPTPPRSDPIPIPFRSHPTLIPLEPPPSSHACLTLVSSRTIRPGSWGRSANVPCLGLRVGGGSACDGGLPGRDRGTNISLGAVSVRHGCRQGFPRAGGCRDVRGGEGVPHVSAGRGRGQGRHGASVGRLLQGAG